MKKSIIIILVILLLGLGLTYIVFAPKLTAVDEFYAEFHHYMHSQDFEEAYAMTCSELREETNLNQFNSFARDYVSDTDPDLTSTDREPSGSFGENETTKKYRNYTIVAESRGTLIHALILEKSSLCVLAFNIDT